jgi:hypothetical protein
MAYTLTNSLAKASFISVAAVAVLAACGPNEAEIYNLIDDRVAIALTAIPTPTSFPTATPTTFPNPDTNANAHTNSCAHAHSSGHPVYARCGQRGETRWVFSRASPGHHLHGY